MKKIIIKLLLIFIICFEAFGSLEKARQLYNDPKVERKNEKITYELIMGDYYFSAIPFAIKHIASTQKINPEFEKALKALVVKAGPEIFFDVSTEVLVKHDSPTLYFVLGLRYFHEKNYALAIKYLEKVPDNNYLQPEVRLTKGAAYSLLGNSDAGYTEYKKCYNYAESAVSSSANDKIKRYYAILKETCSIHVARLKFTSQEYDKSIEAYDEIDKTSYKWPYVLLEKAWVKFKQKDYNRTLGLLVTYKYPLLESYFMPESELLTALSYHKLCLWEDALSVVDQYYKIYKPRSEALASVLIKNKTSDNYFFYLTHESTQMLEAKHPFIKSLITQIKKTVKYNVEYGAYKIAMKEATLLKKMNRDDFIRVLIEETDTQINSKIKSLNWYIKEYMYEFINKINGLSFQLFKIRIDIMSKKRDLIYKGTQLISDRGRGDLKHVNRTVDEQFWEFTGEFWADELGDYSFGLKSNCEEVKQRTFEDVKQEILEEEKSQKKKDDESSKGVKHD